VTFPREPNLIPMGWWAYQAFRVRRGYWVARHRLRREWATFNGHFPE
jgi:hypothetical protein